MSISIPTRIKLKNQSQIHDDLQEKARRRRQIDQGQLQRANGLVFSHQLSDGKYATIVGPY